MLVSIGLFRFGAYFTRGAYLLLQKSQPVPYSTQWIEAPTGARHYVHHWTPHSTTSQSEAPRSNSLQPASAQTVSLQPGAEQPGSDTGGKVVLIVHGLGEHGGRYARLAHDFASAGLHVYAFDQQGHGQDSRPRGCIDSYEGMLQDMETVFRWVREIHQPSRAVMFGHSMGGNLVLNYAMRGYELPDRIVSSSPMIRTPREPAGWFKTLARMMKMVVPNFLLRSEIIVERLMSDPAEQRALKQDELFHSQISLRLGAALLDSGNWLLENANKLTTPTLLTHGTNDFLTSYDASRQFAERAGGACQLKLLEGMMHDPFRDLGRELVVQAFIEYILGPDVALEGVGERGGNA